MTAETEAAQLVGNVTEQSLPVVARDDEPGVVVRQGLIEAATLSALQFLR